MNSIATEYRAAHNKCIRLIDAGIAAPVHSDIGFAVIYYRLAMSQASDSLITDIKKYIRETEALPEPQK